MCVYAVKRGGCAHIAELGRMHACPSGCRSKCVTVRVCARMRRDDSRYRTRCSFERRGNWVTALCKRWFLDALLYMNASKSNTHREDMRTRTSELNFGGWIVRAAKFSWNVANVQLDYNRIHKGNNLSRHVIMWFQAPEILPWQRLLFS